MNTIFIGKVAQHFSNLVSTNDFAIHLIAKTKPIEGTVISTAYQSAGKGQVGRGWFSSRDKNLLLSIILQPKWLLAQNQFLLSQAIALGVADTVNLFINDKVSVKWPNDVYIQDEKVAGILIQNGLIGNKIAWSVIGVGLNVNEEHFPAHLGKAISLKKAGGKELKLEDVRNKLCQCIEQRYLQLKTKPTEIARYYLQNLYQYQSPAKYLDIKTGQVFQGQIIGVNKLGHLAVQRGEEKTITIEYFDLKEIGFL